MASKSLHSFWTLSLLFLVCLSWRSALGGITVSNVSTHSADITWSRGDFDWEHKEHFNISLSSYTKECTCKKIVKCTTPMCHINTLEMCGELAPCCDIIAWVHAAFSDIGIGTYFTTAPEKISNLTLRQEEGVEYISWDNPSPQTSHCHDNTDVFLSYGNFSGSYMHPAAKQNLTLPLCVAGLGHVEVRTVTISSSSHIRQFFFSDATTDDFTYVSDEHMLLHICSCEPVSCTAGEIHWMLDTNCSSGAYDYIKVVTGERQDSASVANTSFVITGLEINKSYNTCLLVMKEEFVMGGDCIDWEMKKNVVENFRADANNSTSITLLWQPSDCQNDHRPKYYATVQLPIGTVDNEATFETTHTFANLKPLTDYKACVVDTRHMYEEDFTVCRNVYTLPAGPTQLQVVKVTETSVRMSWVWQDNDQDVLYEVLWGKNLKNKFLTLSNSYNLDVNGDAMDVHPVCVAAIVTSLGNLTGDRTCRESPPDVQDKHLVTIVVGSVVGGLLVVAAAVGAAVVIRKKQKANSSEGS